MLNSNKVILARDQIVHRRSYIHRCFKGFLPYTATLPNVSSTIIMNPEEKEEKELTL